MAGKHDRSIFSFKETVELFSKMIMPFYSLSTSVCTGASYYATSLSSKTHDNQVTSKNSKYIYKFKNTRCSFLSNF